MNGSEKLAPERRRNLILVTANTEYHLKDGVCVRVWDRLASCWLEQHLALGTRLAGAVEVEEGLRSEPHQGRLEPGAALYFKGEEAEFLTSRLAKVERSSEGPELV